MYRRYLRYGPVDCFFSLDTLKIVNLSVKTNKVHKSHNQPSVIYTYISYPSPPDKGAPHLRAYVPLNGIKLHTPVTHRKVEASNPRIRVKNEVKFTLFAVAAHK